MKLHIAIPVMRERAWIPQTMDCIAQQYDAGDFCVYVCVNQPDIWWDDVEKREVCLDNKATLEWLHNENRFPLEILDFSSKGRGMSEKKSGVGYARKALFDNILNVASSSDLVMSMDADTTFRKDYFHAVRQQFQLFPDHVAMATPYYHSLTGNENMDRAMLRYEVYMRLYALNLTRIGSPYNFTALGSAIVVPVGVLKAVKGITPRTAGEDFYLLQKLRKFGKIIQTCSEKVYPATRFSDRVAFGTGPAISKKMIDLQRSYPLFTPDLFDAIQQTYQQFPLLWENDVATPMDDFLFRQWGERWWIPLRKNFKTKTHFVRACYEKIDGLRILQFLKHSIQETDDKKNFLKNWQCFFDGEMLSVDFQTETIDELQRIRNRLVTLEENLLQKNHQNNNEINE